MADNTPQNGTATIATDGIVTLNGATVPEVQAQRVKIGFGSDGVFRDVDASNGLPVLQNDVTASGSLAAAAQTVVLALNGQSGASVQLSGTWVGTVTFEGSNDGTNWTSVNAVAATTSQPQPTATVNGLYRLTPGGLMQLRANMTAFTSGSATVSMRASAGAGGFFANQILPTKITDGTNTATIKAASTAAVAGDSPLVVTMHPSTAATPVNVSAALPVGSNKIGSVDINADPDTLASGTISTTDIVVAAPSGTGAFVSGTSTSGSYVFVLCPGGDSAWNTQITGLTTGTLYFEGSLDSTNGIDGNWISVNGRQTGVVNTVLSNNSTTNGLYRGNTSGLKYYRIRSVGALTGTPAIVIRLSAGIGATFLNASIPAGANAIGTVQQATLTKATQGTTGVTTQDLKDAGRSARTITLDSFAVAATTETLNTMSYSSDNGTATTGTSYTVTAGKRLRIQTISISVHTIAGNTTSATVIVRLRANNAGAAIVTSPIQLVIPIVGTAVANQAVGPDIIAIPDGWEFVAGAGIGITTTCAGFVTTTAAPKVDISLIGYEY